MISLIAHNTTRRKLRSGLTILGLAIAVMSFVVIRTSVLAWYAGAEAASPNRLVTINAVSMVFSMPVAYKERIEKIDGVTSVACFEWFGGVYIDPKNFFPQFAVDHENYFDMCPEFVIPPDQKEQFFAERNSVVVGRKLADRFGWSVGDAIRLTGTIFPGDWDFVIRAIYTGAKEATDETLWFFHYDYLDERMRAESPSRAGEVGSFVVQIDDPTRAAEISEKIDNLFINSLAETRTETEEAFQLSFIALASSIILGLEIISFLVIGIILLVLANTMAMTARERVSEYAVMKTLGFRRFHIIGLIYGESMFMAIVGGVLGLIISHPVNILIKTAVSNFFPVFEADNMTLIMAMAAAISVGLLAAVFPSVKAIKTPIVDGLRIIE